MFTRNRRFLRLTSWPVLFFTFAFLVYLPYWDPAVRAWASGTYDWTNNEGNVPIEFNAADSRIYDKAADLGNHPVSIYEFVRNKIEYEAYSGCRFGAIGALERGRANDVDQAMLLAALLRGAYRNLGLDQPEAWIVRGDVRLTGKQALAWLGVDDGTAATSYLTGAGVGHSIEGNPSGSNFSLILTGHVWLRADLKFGATRGTRFIDGAEGILADLDPSFVAQETVGAVPMPFELSGIDPGVFAEQVVGYTTRDASQGSVSDIPEAFMLGQADSASTVFRRLLEENSLTAESALQRRRPTVEQIDALPDALPFRLESQPTAYDLLDQTERDDFLDRTRHRFQVRIVDLSDDSVPADVTLSTPEQYGNPLVVAFQGDALLEEDMSFATVSGWSTKDLHPRIYLSGVAKSVDSETLSYGSPVRVEFAYQQPSFDVASPVAPLTDSSARKEGFDTRAGAFYTLSAVPRLCSATAEDYTSALSDHLTALASAGSPAEALGPSLDLVAQTMLAQQDDFLRLGALATGHRVSSVGEWALVGMEPVPNGSDAYDLPRFVFATHEGAIPLTPVVADGDTRLASTDAAQSFLQLTRDAILAHGPSVALGSAVTPVSAGQLTRDANTAELSIYAITDDNADLLDVSGDRIPTTADESVADDLKAAALQGGAVLVPSGQCAIGPPPVHPSLGNGWGYLTTQDDGVRITQTVDKNGTRLRAFGIQEAGAADVITPGALIHYSSTLTSKDRCEFLTNKALDGADAYTGVAESTSQAFVAAAHPIASLLDPSEVDPSQNPEDIAARVGSAVVFLHAMLDEFSFPRVLDVHLEITDGGQTYSLNPGEPFNPFRAAVTKVEAVGTFDQVMDDVDFEAFDGSNVSLGTHSETPPARPTVRWTLKQDSPAIDVFSSGLASDYNGPFEVRLDGDIGGVIKAKQVAYGFVIDTQAPVADIVAWDSGRVYRGDISVRGTADDAYFDRLTVEVAPGLTPSESDYTQIAESFEAVSGIGLLTQWPAAQEGACGDHTVRLTASDRAGNTATETETLDVLNDSQGPAITFVSPATSPLSGDISLQVEAQDTDSTVERLEVWTDFERGYLDDTGAFQVVPANKSLQDETYTGQSSVSYGPTTIDTKLFQGAGFSDFVVNARAHDAFGNITEAQHAYKLNNALFNCFIYNTAIRQGSGIPARVNVYMSDAVYPVVEIKDPANLEGAAVATLTPTYADPYYIGHNTYWNEYTWNGGAVTPGGYVARVTHGSEQVDLELYVLGNYSEADIKAYIQEPMSTVLLKDQDPSVAIKGYVANPGLGDGSRSDTAPIESIFPSSRPYWHLSYKPHSAEPVVDRFGDEEDGEDPILKDFLKNNVDNEANWTEIARGFNEMGDDATPTYATLGSWDISRLPVGEYDLRLVTSDGYWYRTAVALGYKVVHSATLPGQNGADSVPGALRLRQVDLGIDFEGFPIEVARSYNSMTAWKKGDFGYGWSLEDISVEIADTTREYTTTGDQRLTAEITLPDGRTFVYANEPSNYAELSALSGSAIGEYGLKKAWYADEAFISRPLGQMMWLPGYFENVVKANMDSGLYATYYSPGDADRAATDGYKRVWEYLNDLSFESPGTPADPLDAAYSQPDGTIACLRLEGGSYLLFDWPSGKVRARYSGEDDDPRSLVFSYTNTHGAAATDDNDDVAIEDHLGRTIDIERGEDGLIDKITDPNGRGVLYEYTDGDLTKVTDRSGGVRELYYEDPDYPHYLTRMVVKRGGGLPDTEIVYDYDENARLGSIDTGAGTIGMEYEDFASGGGRQTVVDEDTGGRTEVEYDSAGRVTKQTDAAGVVTEYAYMGESVTIDGIVQPLGALASQTVAAVTTDFVYPDLTELTDAPTPRGYDEIAASMIAYHLYQHSGGDISVDYYANGDMKPGYLTSDHVQPSMVSTPAVGPDGQEIANTTNDVEIAYIADATAKIDTITDPEGRVINLDYGDDAARNEVDNISGPAGVTVENTYYSTGNWIGRLNTSTTKRDTETLSTTTYTYDYTENDPDTKFGGTGDLVDIVGDASDAEMTINIGTSNPGDLWPGFHTAYIEKQTVVTTADGDTSTHHTYLDALGNTIATMTPGDSPDPDIWNVTIPDADGRALYSWTTEGDRTIYAYDGAGLLLSTVHTDIDPDIPGHTGDVTVTEYAYDEQGRRTSTTVDGVVVSSVAYETTANGQRRVTTTDENGNQSISATDSAGRQIRDEFIGADGTSRITTYGYDEHGRRNKTTSARGLVTEVAYDDAGREVSTTQRADGRVIETKRGYDRYGRTVWVQTPLQADALTYTTYLYKTDLPATPDTTTTLDDVADVDDPSYGQLVAVYHEDSDDDPTNNGSYSGYYEEYTYDSEGRQTEVTKPQYLNAANPAEPVVTKTLYYGDSEADGDEGQVEYVIFNYDSSTWNENKSGQTSATNVQFRLTYNDDGSRAKCIYPSGMERDFNAEAAEPEETPVTYDITYDYNAESNVATVTRPEGTIDYSYDSVGSLGSIRYFGHTVNYSYDFFDRLERAVAPLGEWNYQYNDVGLKTLVENTTTGDIETRSYDALGRLDTLVHIDSDGAVVFSQDFDVASDGTRTGVLETRGSSDVQWDYEYDELGRLTAERRDANDDSSYEYQVEYAYDEDSNRVSEEFLHSGALRTYAYEEDPGPVPTQRLSSITVNSTVRESFTWTVDGEQESHTWYDSGGVEEKKQTFTWGVFDTLTQVDFHEWDTGDSSWEYQGKLVYAYDDSNTLIRRQQYDEYDALQDDVKYLVDTQNLTGYSQVLAEIDGQTGLLRKLNTYADEIKAEQVSNSDAYSYLHNDALGSIRGLTGADASGSPLSESYNYTVFGSPFAGDDGNRSLTNYAFTGQAREAASGLQHHRARWLNTTSGRWLSVDPWFDFPDNAAALYGYCGNNPALYTDESGLGTFAQVLSVASMVHFVADMAIGATMMGLECAKALGFNVDQYINALNAIDDVWDTIGLVIAVLDIFQLARMLIQAAPKFILWATKYYTTKSARIANLSKSVLKGEVFETLFKMAWGWTRNTKFYRVSGMVTRRAPDFILGMRNGDIMTASKLVEVFWGQTKLKSYSSKYKQIKDNIVLASQTKGKTLMVICNARKLPDGLTELAKLQNVNLVLKTPMLYSIAPTLRSLFHFNIWADSPGDWCWEDDL